MPPGRHAASQDAAEQSGMSLAHGRLSCFGRVACPARQLVDCELIAFFVRKPSFPFFSLFRSYLGMKIVTTA